MVFKLLLAAQYKFNTNKIMKKYLAYYAPDSDYEEFDTIEEAREYLKEGFLDNQEGYHPDTTECKIFELKEIVEVDILSKKTDFTDEEWEDEGYDLDFQEIWKHKFTSVAQ